MENLQNRQNLQTNWLGLRFDCPTSGAMNPIKAIKDPQWREGRITGATVYYSIDPVTKQTKLEKVLFDSLRGYRQCRAEFEGRRAA
jgi:hypothetical protein